MNNSLARDLQSLLLGSAEYIVVNMHRSPAAKDDVDVLDAIVVEHAFGVRHGAGHQTGFTSFRHVLETPADGVLVELNAIELDVIVGPPDGLEVRANIGSKFQDRLGLKRSAFLGKPGGVRAPDGRKTSAVAFPDP